jgi:hypothetical protein
MTMRRLTRARIVDDVALFEAAAVNAEEHEFSGIDVRPELEGERAEFAIVVRLDRHRVFRAGFDALGGRNIQGAGQIIHHGVNQRLHALLFEGGPAQDRNEFELAGQAADGGFEHQRQHRLVFDDQVSHFVVLVGNGGHEVAQGLGGLFLEFVRDFPDDVAQAFLDHLAPAPGDGFLIDNVDDAFEIILRPDGQENGVGVGAEFFAHVLEGVLEIRARAVHLIDKGDAGHAVFGGLAPDGFGLGLHARHAAEDGDGAVEHAHGTLDFGGEIDVARGVDDIDAMSGAGEELLQPVFLFLGPEAGDGGRGDGDAAFALLLHPIGHGIAVIHVANAVDQACIKKNALGRGGLAGINMRGNANIARPLHGKLAFGRVDLFLFCHFFNHRN